MNTALCAIRRAMSLSTPGKSLAGVLCLSVAAALLIAAVPIPAYALVGISGTMSNFDVFNDTTSNAYGAELELEGCSPADITRTYPSHFDTMTMEPYSSGTASGTRIFFKGYNFLGPSTPYIAPTVGQSTNGHYAVNLPGCEHFGFSVTSQPTATRYFWLDQSYSRIGTTPMSVPNANWTYNPPAAGQPAVVAAVVQVPQPEIPEAMLPDSIWMKVYITELERPVDLEELISADPNNPIPGMPSVAPQDQSELELEWVLLEGGVPEVQEMNPKDNSMSIIRRYEYYKYIGPVDPTDNAPLSNWSGVGDPPGDELGDFIAANMVALNLVPEPSSLAALAGLFGTTGLVFRRSRRP